MFQSLALVLQLLACISAAPVKRYTGVIITGPGGNGCLQTSSGRDGPQVGQSVNYGACTPQLETLWNINPGSGSITLTNHPDLALDAGSDPHNGGSLKLWTSQPGLYQQTWYYTDDQRIAITGGDQCLDSGESGQTWQCSPGNTNQVWEVKEKEASAPDLGFTQG